MFGLVEKDTINSNSGTKGVLTCSKLVAESAVIGNMQGGGQLLVNPNLNIITAYGYLPNNYVAAGTNAQLLNKVRNADAATAINDSQSQVLRLPAGAVILQYFVYEDSAPIAPASQLNLQLSGLPFVQAENRLMQDSDTSNLRLGSRAWALLPPYPTTFGTVGAFWDRSARTVNDTTGVFYFFNTPVASGDLVVQLQYVVLPVEPIEPVT